MIVNAASDTKSVNESESALFTVVIQKVKLRINGWGFFAEEGAEQWGPWHLCGAGAIWFIHK